MDNLTRIELPARTTPADRNPAAVYLARLGSDASRRTMLQALNTMAELLSSGRHRAATLLWQDLDYQHTAALRAELARRYAPATANKFLSALRGVLKEAWRLGLMDVEQCQRASDLAVIRGKRLPKGRAVDGSELSALFRVCDQAGVSGVRDAALLASLYGGGLRRSEAVALDLSDFDAANGSLRIRAGKGNKSRIVYLADFACQRLARYLIARGLEAGALFVKTRKSGALVHDRLTDQAVRQIVRRLSARAGIADFSPHDLRRTYCGDLLQAGVDISTVQQLMGHASVSTTQLYDRRGEDVKRTASQKLHVPS